MKPRKKRFEVRHKKAKVKTIFPDATSRGVKFVWICECGAEFPVLKDWTIHSAGKEDHLVELKITRTLGTIEVTTKG